MGKMKYNPMFEIACVVGDEKAQHVYEILMKANQLNIAEPVAARFEEISRVIHQTGTTDKEKIEKISLLLNARPQFICFFPNGLTAVTDQYGRQIGRYQATHTETIRLLKADGIDWGDLETLGSPK